MQSCDTRVQINNLPLLNPIALKKTHIMASLSWSRCLQEHHLQINPTIFNPLYTMSLFCSCSSLTMKIMSKRDNMVGMKSMFWKQKEITMINIVR